MLTGAEYVRQSIETNLFFLRIVKEHLIFAGAALSLRDAAMVPQLMQMKDGFEALLTETVTLAKGVVSQQAMAAGDIVSPYTLRAEMATQNFTGLPINTGITMMETVLFNRPLHQMNPALEQAVNSLNQRIMTLLAVAIQTQKMVLANVLSCKQFTFVYPLMLDHVTREAEHYMQHLQTLQRRESLLSGPQSAAMGEVFWNEIMGEHGKFIRGMLDPTEEELIQKANGFANEFTQLANAARQAYNQLALLAGVTDRSLTAAVNIRNFKEQGTIGILECKIRSIILPLLSDHVMREANHYIKELREFKTVVR